MLTNPTLTDRVRYTLIHDVLGRRIISEPTNFKTDYKNFVRMETHGFSISYNDSYEFYGVAVEFLESIMDSFGGNTVVQLLKEEKNPFSDIWETKQVPELDMLTYDKQGGKITVKAKKGGLERYLEAEEKTC